MHLEVLEDKQKQLLPLLEVFKSNFYLVGGTALALQIGHRKSIDFDLFSKEELQLNKILSKLDKSKIKHVLIKTPEQYTVIYDDVNLTFFHYPFNVKPNVKLEKIFDTVDPLTIGSMKAYALGRRAKWKDYVDLYFILQIYSMADLLKSTKKIYGKLFNDRLFLQQLCYFVDINYSEKVEFMPGKEVDDEIVMKNLVEIVKKV